MAVNILPREFNQGDFGVDRRAADRRNDDVPADLFFEGGALKLLIAQKGEHDPCRPHEGEELAREEPSQIMPPTVRLMRMVRS